MSTKPIDRLLFAQGGQCFFCKKMLPKADASVEHLVAVGNGGANKDENCVVCCKSLNSLLGSMSLKEKIAVVLNQKGKFKCPNEAQMLQYLSAIALVVRDYDEAIDYYVNTLGFVLLENTDMSEGHNSAPGKRWVRVQPPGAKETCFLLARAATPEQLAAIGNQTGGRVFLFLNTDDFWRDYNAYSARGVKWIREPSVQAYGTVAVFVDFYGNKWDLIGPNDKR